MKHLRGIRSLRGYMAWQMTDKLAVEILSRHLETEEGAPLYVLSFRYPFVAQITLAILFIVVGFTLVLTIPGILGSLVALAFCIAAGIGVRNSMGFHLVGLTNRRLIIVPLAGFFEEKNPGNPTTAVHAQVGIVRSEVKKDVPLLSYFLVSNLQIIQSDGNTAKYPIHHRVAGLKKQNENLKQLSKAIEDQSRQTHPE